MEYVTSKFMTISEVSKFVFGKDTAITIFPNKTQLSFKDNTTIYGFFDNNIYESELFKQNKWLFFKTPQDLNYRKSIIINGDDLIKICLVSPW